MTIIKIPNTATIANEASDTAHASNDTANEHHDEESGEELIDSLQCVSQGCGYS